MTMTAAGHAISAGPNNALTDVEGILVGHADNAAARTGTSVILFEEPATASVSVMGGAPGTRETDLLRPDNTVERIDALVLSGGSAFGLAAADAVMRALAEGGRGFAIGPHKVPIVPSAILFDLMNGGEKTGHEALYGPLGLAALNAASASEQRCGSIGAGRGALTARIKGGVGTASEILGQTRIAALVAVNALGSPLIGQTRHFHAAAFEIGDEFGGLGFPAPLPADAAETRLKGTVSGSGPTATTIGLVATDARLTKAQCRRLAVAGQDGLARALFPAHTVLDGDTVFAAATGRAPAPADPHALMHLEAAAARVMARAIARAVFHAEPEEGDRVPAWKNL